MMKIPHGPVAIVDEWALLFIAIVDGKVLSFVAKNPPAEAHKQKSWFDDGWEPAASDAVNGGLVCVAFARSRQKGENSP